MKHLSKQTARGRIAAGVLTAATLFFAACQPMEQRAAEKPARPARQDTPQAGGTLVRRLPQDVNTLNLLLHTTESEKFVLSYLYDPLVDLDEKMEFIPALAERWEISPDGKIYTFYLDKRATWSDGTPVRASDVVFTLKKIVDPATQSTQLAGMFEGLDPKTTKAVDDHTVQVGFERARAAQMVAFNVGMLPERHYRTGSMTKDLNWKAIGNGPYVLTNRETGKEILLTRRLDYWRETPYVDRILFKVLPQDAVGWNAMKRGEIDETRLSSDIWKMERNDPAVRNRMEIFRFYTLGYNFLAWNNRDPILKDREVRRALTMAFDRRKIVNNLYHGTARLISGPFAPDHWAYNPEVKPIEFDPRGARALFESVGWKDSDGDGILDRNGTRMKIEIIFQAGNAPSIQQGQILQADLKNVGVQLDLTPLDAASLIPRVLGGKYQGVFLGWNLDLDPDVYSLFHSSQVSPQGQNFVFYSNPEVDRLIEQARVELDRQKLSQLYHHLHAILAEDQPYTWTFQVSEKWGVSRRLKNVRAVDGLGLFFWYPGSLQWWIPLYEQRAGKVVATPQ